jgi:hypothetical protein
LLSAALLVTGLHPRRLGFPAAALSRISGLISLKMVLYRVSGTFIVNGAAAKRDGYYPKLQYHR